MSTQNETSAVTALIKAYGEALSTGNAKAIGGFYGNDGAILPNGHNTVQQKQLNRNSGQFLRENNFKIEYQIENTVISGDYAIVESVATASSSSTSSKAVNKTTRDLFILRKYEGAWKIYRYIFNSAE